MVIRSVLLAAVAVLGAAAVAAGAVPLLAPTLIWINEQYHTGGAYTALQAAPDGRVYLGTTFYGGFARLLVLSPGAREFQLITDMATATGEKATGPNAQAKIHTKPAVAPDGRIYFATKSGEPARRAAEGSYPGGHLLVYEPQANRVVDLGIPRPRQGIIAVGVDPQRNIVYALTDPEVHLVIFDPRTRTFTDRGAFGPHPPTRYLVVLANGDAFHPAGSEGVMRYSAAGGRIERLPLQFAGRGSYESPYALAAGPDGTRFHGVGEDSGEVYTFTPGPRTVDVQLHGAVSPEGYAPPGSHYTMTAAPDGNIYYTAVLPGGGERGLFLMRLVVRTGRPEVVGRVGPLPTAAPNATGSASHVRRPARQLIIQGSTAGPDGTLYVMTAYPLRILVFPRLAGRP